MPEDDTKPAERTPDPGWIGADPQYSQTIYKKLQENKAKKVADLGGPEGFIRAMCPNALSLFAGPWSEKLVLSENEVGWSASNQRIAECARCPTRGGTPCESSTLAVKEGIKVRIDAERIHYDRCDRFGQWVKERRIIRAGVPHALIDVTIGSLLERSRPNQYPLRDQLEWWVQSAVHEEKPPSFLLTGGQSKKRTGLAVGIARSLCRNPGLDVHYTFGPLLAALLREHYNEEIDTDPLDRCAKAAVLVFDFLDPVPQERERWKPWFVERIDRMLFTRLSDKKPTILVSRARVAELQEHFHLMGVLPLLELDVMLPEFGPFRS